MLTEDSRRDIIDKTSERILKTLEIMSGYSKLQQIKKLVGMLDDMHLIALDFAIDMTPEQPAREKKN